MPPTKSAADEMSEKAKEQLTKLAKEMGMPVWALYCIGIGKLKKIQENSMFFFVVFFYGIVSWPAVRKFDLEKEKKHNLQNQINKE